MELYVFGCSDHAIELPGDSYPLNYDVCGTIEELESVIVKDLPSELLTPLTFIGIKQDGRREYSVTYKVFSRTITEYYYISKLVPASEYLKRG